MSETYISTAPTLEELCQRKERVLLTVEQTGRLLHLGRHPVERLKRTGYLASPTLTAVEKLVNRPTITGGIPVLRLGEPAMDGDRRIGHERTDVDTVLLEASLGWWGGPIETVMDTGWLALSVASFVIGVLRIDGIRKEFTDARNYRRVLFEGELVGRIDDLIDGQPRVLDKSFAKVTKQLLGNRVPNPQGAPIVIV